MSTSYPEQNNVTVSFRCSAALKTLIDSAAQSYRLSNSELIRHGVDVMIHLLNNSVICEQASDELRKLLSPIVDVVLSIHDKAHERDEFTVSTIVRQEVNLRHITILNRKDHSFNGCRVTIVRHKQKFERYFSAKEYGSMDTALAVAIKVRDCVLEQLLRCPNDVAEVFTHAMAMAPPPYPRRRVIGAQRALFSRALAGRDRGVGELHP